MDNGLFQLDFQKPYYQKYLKYNGKQDSSKNQI